MFFDLLFLKINVDSLILIALLTELQIVCSANKVGLLVLNARKIII